MKVAATFDRFSSRADGSFGLSFSTQESADVLALQSNVRSFGWLVFQENEIQDEDIPKEDAEETKTPSQRQRAILYRLWEQSGKTGTFETYYRTQMEKIADWLKGKLEK